MVGLEGESEREKVYSYLLSINPPFLPTSCLFLQALREDIQAVVGDKTIVQVKTGRLEMKGNYSALLKEYLASLGL